MQYYWIRPQHAYRSADASTAAAALSLATASAVLLTADAEVSVAEVLALVTRLVVLGCIVVNRK